MHFYIYKVILTLSFILILQKCIFVTSNSYSDLRDRRRIVRQYLKEGNYDSDSVEEMDMDYDSEPSVSGESENISFNDILFKKWLNALLSKMKEENWDFKDVNFVELQIDGEFFIKLHTVLDKSLFTVTDLDEDIVDAISGARINNYRSRGLLNEWLGLNFLFYNYHLVIVFLLISYCGLCFVKNYLKSLFAIIIVICMTFWNWMKLYQQKIAEKQSVIENLLHPLECRRGELSWYEGLQIYFFGKVAGSTDCKKYYEALLVDPIWEVSLPVAFSNALSQTIFESLKEFGTALNLFFKNLYSDFSLLGVIGVSVFIFIFVIIIYGYKISFFWYILTLEPSNHITQNSHYLDTVKNCCKNILCWKSEPEVTRMEDNATKNVKDLSQSKQENIEQHQVITQCQNLDRNSSQILHQYFSYSISKLSSFAESSLIYSKKKLFSMLEHVAQRLHHYKQETSNDSSIPNKVQAVTFDQNLFSKSQDHSCHSIKEGISNSSSDEAPLIDLEGGLFAHSDSSNSHLYDYKQEGKSDLCEKSEIPPVTLNENSSNFNLLCQDKIDLNYLIRDRTDVQPVQKQCNTSFEDLINLDSNATLDREDLEKKSFKPFFENLVNLDSSTNATLDWDHLGKKSYNPFSENLANPDSSTKATLHWDDLGKKSYNPFSKNLANPDSSTNATLDWDDLRKKSYNPVFKNLENLDSSTVRERNQSTRQKI